MLSLRVILTWFCVEVIVFWYLYIQEPHRFGVWECWELEFQYLHPNFDEHFRLSTATYHSVFFVKGKILQITCNFFFFVEFFASQDLDKELDDSWLEEVLLLDLVHPWSTHQLSVATSRSCWDSAWKHQEWMSNKPSWVTELQKYLSE